MAGKTRRSNRSNRNRIPENPRIVELDNLQDFKDYVGHKEVPEKTLMEQIEALKAKQPAPKSAFAMPETPADLSPMGKFMFGILDYTAFLIPLLSVFIVLNMLVRLQYGDNFVMMDIVKDSLKTIPVIAVLYAFVHPYNRLLAFKVASFVASLAIGGYLIYVSNEEGYYLMMQRAPPLGTVWVWLFIEMDWEWSAVSLLLVGAYTWAKGYSL